MRISFKFDHLLSIHSISYFLFKFQSIFVIIAAVHFIIITKRKNGNISNNNIAASDYVCCRSLPPMHQSKLLIQQHTIHLKIPILLIICTQFANVSFHQFCSLSIFLYLVLAIAFCSSLIACSFIYVYECATISIQCNSFCGFCIDALSLARITL